MIRLRRHLGAVSGEVLERLLEGLADVESRAHLSVPLTRALTELMARRGGAGTQDEPAGADLGPPTACATPSPS